MTKVLLLCVFCFLLYGSEANHHIITFTTNNKKSNINNHLLVPGIYREGNNKFERITLIKLDDLLSECILKKTEKPSIEKLQKLFPLNNIKNIECTMIFECKKTKQDKTVKYAIINSNNEAQKEDRYFLKIFKIDKIMIREAKEVFHKHTILKQCNSFHELTVKIQNLKPENSLVLFDDKVYLQDLQQTSCSPNIGICCCDVFFAMVKTLVSLAIIYGCITLFFYISSVI